MRGLKQEGLQKQEINWADADIKRASDLLYDIINSSVESAGDCLETEIHGARATLTSMYWSHKELMRKIMRGGEKTLFLSMSLIEDTFQKAYPLLLINVKTLIEEGELPLQRVRELQEIFQKNPYKRIWKEKAEIYQNIVKQLGFSVTEGAYENLTDMLNPLLDALTFYSAENRALHIYKVRDGQRSSMRPLFANCICKYASEKELVDTVAQAPQEALVVFGAVGKKHSQTDDKFAEWYYERPNERQTNLMRYYHVSAEEYSEMIDEASKCVYLCVKSGETLWLIPMPYSRDYALGCFRDEASKYYYGSRAGYAPYEVFYNEIPAAPRGTSFLTIRQTGYKLAELMDDEQKIWLPVFLNETCNMFFGEKEPDAVDIVFQEETAMQAEVLEDGQLISYTSKALCIPQYMYCLPAPEELFADEPPIQKLIRYFGITPKALVDIPLLPAKYVPRQKIDNCIEGNVRKAYLKLLAEYTAELMRPIWDLRKELLSCVEQGEVGLIERVCKGKVNHIELVEGAPVTDDIRRALKEVDTYYGRSSSPVIHISSDLYRSIETWQMQKSFRAKPIWIGKKAKKPSVIWMVHPRSAAEYAALLNVEIEKLPDILKLSEEIIYLNKAYGNSLPDSLTGYPQADRATIYMPALCDIHFLMTKNVRKQLREIKLI